VEISGLNYLGFQPGLAVPDYANMDSIPQLRGAEKLVEGRVISLASDMADEALLKKALGAYDLESLKIDTTQKLVFDEYMRNKTADQEWVLVYTHQPHYSTARHDLRFLKDPQEAFGQPQQVVTIAHKGFRLNDELASSFLSSMIVPKDDFARMLDQMRLGTDLGQIVADWKTKNAVSIAGWMPPPDDKDLENMFGGGE
jgi:glycine betaine/proline transport system substrate-binding protein